MNQLQLKYFLTVYKYRNISLAAEEIHISRQALGKAIRELESELGSPLFIRTKKGVEPTAIAGELVSHAEIVIREFEMIEKINYLESMKSRELTLCVYDAVLDYLSADFLIEFMKKYPDIILNIEEKTDEEAKDMILLEQADVAISTDAVDLSHVEKTPLYDVQYCVIINKDNPLSEKEFIGPEDYKGQLIIGKSKELKYYARDTNIKMKEGIDYKFIIEVNNRAIRQELVQKNIGIALAWDYTTLMDKEIPGCVLRPMYNIGFGHTAYLLESRNPNNRKRVEIFKQALLNWLDHRSI